MDGESSVVRLNNGIRHLGGRHNGEGCHHTVWELLTDLGDQEGTHTSTGTSTKGVGDLETLEAVAALGLTTHDVEDLVDQFGTLGVMALGPVVTGTGLAEDEVVGAEELAEGSSADGVHGSGLQVDEDGTGDELVARGLLQNLVFVLEHWMRGVSMSYLVEVNVHALELEIGGAIIPAQMLEDTALTKLQHEAD